MSNSEYLRLKSAPPVLTVKEDAKDVRVKWISVMCDNEYEISFRKNDDGNFEMSGGRFSLLNFQFVYPSSDMEWAADEGNWKEVFNMMNTGTGAIQSVKSR